MRADTVTELTADARARLTVRDAALIEEAAASLSASDDPALLERAAVLAAQPLPVFDRLRTIARTGAPAGAVVLEGFPLDDVAGNAKNGYVTEIGLLAAASALGAPVGYASQRAGRLVHDLRPIREHASEQLGTGSVELIWHTEEAHTELAPRFVVLLCVRGDAEAATLVSRVRRNLLPEAVRERLQVADFVIGSDASHQSTSVRTCALITPHRVTFDPLFTSCADAEAEAALGVLADHVDEQARRVVLRRGELMVIDNFAAAHARTAYAPRYDCTDRWLQRAVVLETPPPPASVVSSRPNVVAL